MTDQNSFLQWYRQNYPDSPLTDEQVLVEYEDYYNCKCISCETRKELGQIPVRQLPQCTAPMSAQRLIDNLERLYHPHGDKTSIA